MAEWLYMELYKRPTVTGRAFFYLFEFEIFRLMRLI